MKPKYDFNLDTAITTIKNTAEIYSITHNECDECPVYKFCTTEKPICKWGLMK